MQETVSAIDMSETLVALLAAQAERRGDQVALTDTSGAALTYAELWHSARKVAGRLAELGVERGNRVLVMLDNTVDHPVLLAGLAAVGATSVPINTAQKGAVLAHMVADSAARVAVIEDRFVEVMTDAAGPDRLDHIVVRGPGVDNRDSSDQAPGRLHDFSTLLSGEPDTAVEAHPSDIALLVYTSGTTGLSKAVAMPNLELIHAQGGRHFLSDTERPLSAGDVVLVVCPLFHVSGLGSGLVAAWRAGARAHVAHRFSASGFWREVSEAGATFTMLVGAMGEILLRNPVTPEDRTHGMRRISMVPATRIEEFAERFGVEVCSSYGSTETGAIIVSSDAAGLGRSVMGRAREGYEIRLVDERDDEVPIGVAGEIVVRSSRPWLISPGYPNDVAATAAAWRNGWFHTGDSAVKDEAGNFHFAGRIKDAIRRRGENISAFEVEREATAHPEVVECAAFGITSAESEEEVKIAVVRTASSKLTEQELVEFLQDRLAYYAVPRYIAFVDRLPRTETHKIQKGSLRALGVDGAWDRVAAGMVVSRD